MIKDISQFNTVFFIGVAGVGMSAIAQYLSGVGKQVAGSDRFFNSLEYNRTKEQLEEEGIQCFAQDGSGISAATELIVVSSAIEDTVAEVKKAKELGIPIIKRSELLALIAKSKRTVAVAGTSGKSTTAAMLFQILRDGNMDPSIITGAGLTSIIKEGKLGNAYVGKGEWLIIEADESDGSVIQYTPEIGLLLNIDKDHQEIEELISLFQQFKSNTTGSFVVNLGHELTQKLSDHKNEDFGFETPEAHYNVTNYVQNEFEIRFELLAQGFEMNALGQHSAENAAAAVAVAHKIGVDLKTCAESLKSYEGIFRRHQIVGEKNGIWVIDDYAHNPAKCAASIRAVQAVRPKVIAWFQPHGFGPTRFLKDDFIQEISSALREKDEIWMSEIYYAGGSATKDISANDLVKGIQNAGKQAFFVEDRKDLLKSMRSHLDSQSVLLLMGARDPSLESFANEFFEEL